jgi:hypothetical protein
MSQKKRKQNITLCFLYHGLNKKNAKKEDITGYSGRKVNEPECR